MRYLAQHNLTAPARSARGFSLVEIMIAMGVFAVGFVAVAAMFPAAIVLQKETISDVESQLVARNAGAMVRSRQMDFKEAGTVGTGFGQVDLNGKSGTGQLQSFPHIASGVGGGPAASDLGTRWKLGDRSYPTAQGLPADRRYYWVPMIRRTKDPAKVSDWILVVFVMRREAGVDYSFSGAPYPAPTPVANGIANPADGAGIPKVYGVAATASGSRFTMANRLFAETSATSADQVRAGDYVADNSGVVYFVQEADNTGFTVWGAASPGANTIWYAPPPSPGASSPCTRVLPLSGVIQVAP